MTTTMVNEFQGHTVTMYKDANGNDILKITRPAKTRTGIKTVAHIRFRSLNRLFEWLNQWEKDLLSRIAHKEEMKAKKSEGRKGGHPYQVGQILYNSWGYDQTNIDFYQIVATTKGTVTIREIAGTFTETGFMSGRTHAIRDKFVGEPQVKRPQFSPYGSTGWHIPMRHGILSLTTENETHYSSYYA